LIARDDHIKQEQQEQHKMENNIYNCFNIVDFLLDEKETTEGNWQ